MSAPFPKRPSPWLQAGLVFLLTGAVVCLLFHRVTWADWSEPHWLEGDPLEVYARVKISGEQPAQALTGLNTVEALGAPVGAVWTGYPAPDRIIFVLTGWLSHRLGLIASIQLMSALIFGLNAVSFLLCARWLRWRWEWSVALAVAFALCTYNLRWGITLSFSQTFTLPPLFLLCARAARPGPNPTRSWTLLAVALGLWLGQGNPYLAYFTGFVAGGTLLLAALRRVPRPRVAPLAVFLGVLTFCFLVANASHVRNLITEPEGNALVRSLDDVRTYSLRPIEWLIPPADHRLSWLGDIGRRYHAQLQGRGEFFYNYLGVVGLVAGLGLIASRALVRGRRRWCHLDALFGLLWITAFGVVGGINYWLGVAGLDLFRASTRIGVFAQVWIFLFLGGWLTRRCLAWPRPLSLGLALALGFISIWDQTPPLGDVQSRHKNAARWETYRTLTARLEIQLPPDAMVFQLPVVPFPEAGRTGGMPDYQHLLPYLTSTSLRYSYGQLRTAPALRWSSHVAKLSLPEMLAALEGAGFQALWIDPRAYADGAAPLLAALTAAGRPELTSNDQNPPVRVFRLAPTPHPQVPDFSDPRLQEPWDEAHREPVLLALRGWYGLETEGNNRWRWARRQASLGLWSDHGGEAVTLRFRLGGPAQSTVIVKQAGREVWRASPGEEIHRVTLPLAAGLNTLTWELTGSTFRPSDKDPRELGFMVENLSLSVP